MITLQGPIDYAGVAATAPASGFTADLDFPVYQYALAADGQTAQRQTSGAFQRNTLAQAFTDKTYRVAPDQGFVAGADPDSAALAWQYALKALQSDPVSALTVTASVGYRLAGSGFLGSQAIDVLCLPKLSLQPAQLAESTRSSPTTQQWLANSRRAFDALKKQVLDAGIEVPDGSLLSSISALTVLDGDAPALPDKGTADIKDLLDSTGARASSPQATKLLALIRKSGSALYEFTLEVPEATLLSIGGKFTVVDPAGGAIKATDFTPFTVTAQVIYRQDAAPRLVSRQFTDST